MEHQSDPQVIKKPYITIVIAIMNVSGELKKTLDSLDHQEFKEFEVLVADCNSNDDPAAYMKKRSYPISHFVQSDEGIYDAWNKVLPFAKGEWVIFMGAGDEFFEAASLRKAVVRLENLEDNVLMAYGQVNVIGENGQLLKISGAPWPVILEEIIDFDMFPHQATFQRLTSFERFGLFNKEITIAGDTDMILRLAAFQQPVFFPLIISSFVYGGVSNAHKSKEKTVLQHLQVLCDHGYNPKVTRIKSKLIILKVLRAIMSENGTRQITDIYRRITGRTKRFG